MTSFQNTYGNQHIFTFKAVTVCFIPICSFYLFMSSLISLRPSMCFVISTNVICWVLSVISWSVFFMVFLFDSVCFLYFKRTNFCCQFKVKICTALYMYIELFICMYVFCCYLTKTLQPCNLWYWNHYYHHYNH